MQLKINFTTVTLFKVASNYVELEYHSALFFSRCKSSSPFLFSLFSLFSLNFKLKDIRITGSFETFWLAKKRYLDFGSRFGY